MTDGAIRVRFPPSPTGSPHVGLVRSMLFNWAFARHHGGTFVLRIEDTDAARNTQESYDGLFDLFGWLGLTWDEGPDIGGPHAPYRQSERGAIYRDALERLTAGGHTYRCYCTTDEVAARRQAAGSKDMGYDRFCRDLSDEQVAAFEAEGRAPVTRFRMPEGDIVFDDLVRGRVTFHSDHVPDYALARANGDPLYTLVNPLDDALMGITHVLRGEDLLSSTPRQVPLYAALAEVGLGSGAPLFGHLPYVMGQGNKKLSKRDPEAHALAYRDQGFLPEGLLNYLALLGWSIAADRDVFTMEEMVAAFDIRDVNPNPARFDIKKCEAINAAHMRLLSTEEIGRRSLPFLVAAGLVADPPTDAQQAVLDAAMPLVAERMNKLTESVDMLGFLLVDEADFERQETVDDAGRPVAQAAHDALSRAAGVDDGRDRGRAAHGARRGDGAQAATGVRPGPGRRHRPPHLAAALREPRPARA